MVTPMGRPPTGQAKETLEEKPIPFSQHQANYCVHEVGEQEGWTQVLENQMEPGAAWHRLLLCGVNHLASCEDSQDIQGPPQAGWRTQRP